MIPDRGPYVHTVTVVDETHTWTDPYHRAVFDYFNNRSAEGGEAMQVLAPPTADDDHVTYVFTGLVSGFVGCCRTCDWVGPSRATEPDADADCRHHRDNPEGVTD